MKKLKPLLALLLVFVAGVALGVVVTRVVTRNFIRRAITHPELVRERIESELVRKLKLDSGQHQQVHEALADSQKQLRDLRREFQPQFGLIISNAQTRIAAVLTPAQREQFEKFQMENRHFLPAAAPLPPLEKPALPHS